MKQYQTFRFVSWEQQGNALHFHYSFDDALSFSEQLVWPQHVQLPQTAAFKRAADTYHLLAGVSYYKTYLAPQMLVESQSLTQPQADFLNHLYLQGLGEFLYKNKLDPSKLASFEATTESSALGTHNGHVPLVLIGGGKDSLVTVDLLRRADMAFETFRVNSLPWIDEQMAIIGAPTHALQRVLDPQLLKENERGAFNGHVPVTAVISAAAVLQAIVSRNSAVVVSSEASANIPNTEYRGLDINHQYSKTLEFEAAFADYIRQHITTGLEYVSLLRPWTELRISEYFAEHVLPGYSHQWSSSNHNFKTAHQTELPEWDPTSPKTMSVFGMLAAFVGRQELVEEFGANVFEEGPLETWEELLGISGIKPFECVADIDEMRLALHLAQRSNQWPELIDFEVPEVLADDYRVGRRHRIPDEFIDVLPETT